MKKIIFFMVFYTISAASLSAQTDRYPKYKQKRHQPNASVPLKLLHSAAAIDTQTHAEKTKNLFLDRLTGNFYLNTNYVDRGISQTNNNPSIQGALTYTFPVGLYVRAWAGNVDFPAPNAETATIEIDTVIGFHQNITEDFKYDVSILRYNYSGARLANYNEIDTLFKYKIFQLIVNYTNNINNAHTLGLYTNFAIIVDIPANFIFKLQDVNFQAGIGHFTLGKTAGNSYKDYNVALTKKLNNTYSVAVQWTGTDGHAKLYPLDKNQIIGTISANF